MTLQTLTTLGRHVATIALMILVATFFVDAATVATLTRCVAATLATVVLASFSSWAYSQIRFDQMTHDSSTDQARIRALGLIYLGTAIIVGMVFWGVYFTQLIPAQADFAP
jgi:uncharacterized membrane protein YwzB